MTINQKISTSFITKLLAIRKEIGSIAKNGINNYQKYSYVMEADVNRTFVPVLDKHRIFVFTSVANYNAREYGSGCLTTVELEVAFIDADSGEQISCIFYGDGWDKGDKGVFKAITGALKYALMKTFLVATGDDPEQDDPIPHAQPNSSNHILPATYMQLRKQAEQGEDALRHAWNTLSAEDRRDLFPYRKDLKQIAQQSNCKQTNKSSSS